jgi:hypothetical protein
MCPRTPIAICSPVTPYRLPSLPSRLRLACGASGTKLTFLRKPTPDFVRVQRPRHECSQVEPFSIPGTKCADSVCFKERRSERTVCTMFCFGITPDPSIYSRRGYIDKIQRMRRGRPCERHKVYYRQGYSGVFVRLFACDAECRVGAWKIEQ